MEAAVDPRFARHFGLQIWKRAQEKEYFEQRKAYREWWWNHTILLAWRCLTWGHASVLFAGTFAVAKALFWIRINWFLLSVAAQATCELGEHVVSQCFTLGGVPADIANIAHIISNCTNATAPLTSRMFTTLVYDPAYFYYLFVPQTLESGVVGPFLVAAFVYRTVTLRLYRYFPWLYLTGMVCLER
jgi:hypothetical protein